MKNINISSEKIRVYSFVKFDGSDDYEITINHPETLYITDDGGHRVQNEGGWVYYIPKEWTGLKWLPRKGSPAVIA
jgi:hypothetical protein